MLKKSALGVSLVRQREKMGYIIRDELGKEMGFSSAKVASKLDAGKSSKLSKDPAPEISSAAQSKWEMMSSGIYPAPHHSGHGELGTAQRCSTNTKAPSPPGIQDSTGCQVGSEL